MTSCVFDRPVPAEAEVAVAWRDGNAGERVALLVGAMHVELLLAQPEHPAAAFGRDSLGADHACVEIHRLLPLGDVDHAMVEACRRFSHELRTSRRALL